MQLLKCCAFGVVLFVLLGCGAAPEPTPDPWVDLLKRIEFVEQRIGALTSSAGLLKRMVDIHGRTEDCLELGYLADDILGEGNLSDMRVDLEVRREFLVRSDRDMEMYEFLSELTDIDLEYLYRTQDIVNEALGYGEENACWPS